MIEPILSLAFSMQSSKGVYALLLGSGVSRASGIPTGWDIVLDLIRKLAAIKGLDCEPDPAAWYKDTFGEDPDYSKLLDDIAKTAAERNQLLRSYFEPTEADREAGLKIPTESHKAIAQLVVGGFIKVIITTNFDKLLEEALHSVGIVPTVISTPDAVDGALPLMHSTCTVIKINGDYLDVRIKNTPEELADYDERINALLDRVLDEFGLIVCGWSGVWDTALRGAIERCKNHRFTTFWTTRAELGEVSKKLVELRRAQTITIFNSDGFFKELAEKVSALEEYSRPHPLSAKAAVVSLKKYIVEDRHRINLHDLLTYETEKLYIQLFSDSSSLYIPYDSGKLIKQLQQYEALSDILLQLIMNGCYHGTKVQDKLWSKCLDRIANPPENTGGHVIWNELRKYPALLLLYSGCIAALAAGRYETFAFLITRQIKKDTGEDQPLIFKINNVKVLKQDYAKHIPGMLDRPTPFSEYLFNTLRNSFKDLLPQDFRFENYFDRFEYLLSLVHADYSQKLRGHAYGPWGCYVWRNEDYPEKNIMDVISKESDKDGADWLLLKLGLFGGSLERFREIKVAFDDVVKKNNTWY